MAVSRAEQQQMLGSEETGLQEHSDNNCLYCAGLSVLGVNSHDSNPGGILFLVKWNCATHIVMVYLLNKMLFFHLSVLYFI